MSKTYTIHRLAKVWEKREGETYLTREAQMLLAPGTLPGTGHFYLLKHEDGSLCTVERIGTRLFIDKSAPLWAENAIIEVIGPRLKNPLATANRLA